MKTKTAIPAHDVNGQLAEQLSRLSTPMKRMESLDMFRHVYLLVKEK
jgi:hypothetical protein